MNKVAIITGGGRGLGAEIVRVLARSLFVVINYNNSKEKAEKVLEDVKTSGGQGVAFKADVRNFNDCEALFKEARKHGRVEVLINNAGITKQGLLCDMAETDYNEIMDTNFKGVFNTCKLAYKAFTEQNSGVIVNISSVDALKGNSCESIYSASKGAVVAFSKSLKKELAFTKVKVFWLCPKAIDTDMLNIYKGFTGKKISSAEIAKKVERIVKSAQKGYK